jgi:hypothetical protein
MKALIGIAAVLLAATACSSTRDAQRPPDVASLATPEATGSASVSPSPQGEPSKDRARFRIDMTDQEKQDLYRVYTECLKDHGVDVLLSRQGGQKPDKAKSAAAAKACDSKLPLPPWEEDATNPQALDFAEKVVQCLRAKGVKKVEVSTNDGIVGPALGGPENDPESISKGMDLTPQCEKEVSAATPK